MSRRGALEAERRRSHAETPRERHDRMMLEIAAAIDDIDAALAECGAASAGLAPVPG